MKSANQVSWFMSLRDGEQRKRTYGTCVVHRYLAWNEIGWEWNLLVMISDQCHGAGLAGLAYSAMCMWWLLPRQQVPFLLCILALESFHDSTPLFGSYNICRPSHCEIVSRSITPLFLCLLVYITSNRSDRINQASYLLEIDKSWPWVIYH